MTKKLSFKNVYIPNILRTSNPSSPIFLPILIMFFVLIYCLVDKTQKFKCATNLIALGQTMVVELGAVGERGSRVGAELQQRGEVVY